MTDSKDVKPNGLLLSSLHDLDVNQPVDALLASIADLDDATDSSDQPDQAPHGLLRSVLDQLDESDVGSDTDSQTFHASDNAGL